MTEPSDLISQYRALPRGSDSLGDCPENDQKVNLLAELDEYANEPSVAKLLLDVVSAVNEYDLARIEAVKIIGIYVDENCPLCQPLRQQVWHVFANSEDDTLVRQHASQRLELGFGGEDEQQIVERILFDDEEDESIRHGAFDYLKATPDRDFAKRVCERLRNDPYWLRFENAICDIEDR